MIREEVNPKHTPLISIEKIGENLYKIEVEVGKEVKHPNEFSHNINWVDIYYKPENKEVVHIARVEFKAHGEYKIFTEPKVVIYAKLNQKGKIIAMAYCTLHGVWKAEKEVNI